MTYEIPKAGGEPGRANTQTSWLPMRPAGFGFFFSTETNSRNVSLNNARDASFDEATGVFAGSPLVLRNGNVGMQMTRQLARAVSRKNNNQTISKDTCLLSIKLCR
ncbi:MAG: hypothetical protein HY043_09470 [Verrucomicrobia bacterium]|nr:hypothetical protein [Verrucomicrobiota bacterium]